MTCLIWGTWALFLPHLGPLSPPPPLKVFDGFGSVICLLPPCYFSEVHVLGLGCSRVCVGGGVMGPWIRDIIKSINKISSRDSLVRAPDSG